MLTKVKRGFHVNLIFNNYWNGMQLNYRTETQAFIYFVQWFELQLHFIQINLL